MLGLRPSTLGMRLFVELRDYLKVARRRWRIVAGWFLAAISVAAIVTIQATPQYASEARLFVSTAQSDTSAAYQGGLFSAERVTSYADLVSGRELSSRVASRLDLESPPEELAEQISAVVVPETVILQLTVVDSDPRQARRLAQTYADELTKFVAELETNPGAQRAPIKASIVDAASLPSSPVSPQPVRNLALGALLGLLLGLVTAVVRELLDTSVKSNEDVSQAVGAPVMGSIAYDSNAPRKPLVTSLDSHAPRVEAFRVLRTNMQFVDVDKDSKVFVVTSSLPQEGKTTTSENLAITLAQAGQRVALVDGDLRRPKIADNLRLESAVGLTTVLVGHLSLDNAIQNSSIENLWVLTSGATPPNPSELLQSHAMTDVLTRLRKTFDVIVIDAPPLLPVTDAALLTSQSDGALIVVRHGKTTKDQLRHAVERLEAVGGRTLGVVLNMVPHRRSADAYGYGYGYGYAPEAGRRKADPVAGQGQIEDDTEPFDQFRFTNR